MTPRDALAQLIHDAGCPNKGCQPLLLDYHRADTIINAGWKSLEQAAAHAEFHYDVRQQGG